VRSAAVIVSVNYLLRQLVHEIGSKTSTVVLSPDGSLAYISTWEDTETGSPDLISKVYVVDTATNDTLEVLDTTDYYSYLAVSPAGDRIYLIRSSGDVSAITFGSSDVV
jgi:DNA-binding beta-propeller fold protein YncE